MNNKKWLLYLGIISFIATVIIYSRLPDQIPIHWNVKGEVDNYGGRYSALILGALPVVLYYLMIIIPRIDPRRDNYLKHGKAYAAVKMAIILFFIAVHWITIASSLGADINISKIIPIGVGIIFIVIGNVMSQIRHNYFFGIRTPWTLANEVVWKKTHRMGGILFVVMGTLFIIAGLLNNPLVSIVSFSSVMIMVIWLFVYSYLVFKKQ